MDRLQAMQVFMRVVETNSFSKAAETLSLAPSSVTSIIKNLEAFLDVRLLQRTTRRLNLTADGTEYFDRCRQILHFIEETEASLHSATRQPKGRLRVDMPGSIGRMIVLPKLAEFEKRYPDIELMIGLTDRPVDLIQEGVDCVIRTGALADSSLVAKRIGLLHWVTCATPEYLESNGVPKNIGELDKHRAVNYFSSGTGRVSPFYFNIDGKDAPVQMQGNIAVNQSEAYLACGLEGLGLLQLSAYNVIPHLESGQLISVLQDVQASPLPVSLMFPHNRHLSPTVRAFVDWASEVFEQDEGVRATPGIEMAAAA
ncbi:LysR family transcriptional regulator [Oxalobacteraceae bacterium CAVE-383]|nr:LysR family transcriptional regulator [Oxalobacteraceae bacterium CAVE-383]